MALEIIRLDRESTPRQFVTAKQKLWLTADRERLVEDGNRDAAFLFCTVGSSIALADAVKFGLVEAAVVPETVGAEPPAAEKVEVPTRPKRPTKKRPTLTGLEAAAAAAVASPATPEKVDEIVRSAGHETPAAGTE